MAVHAHPDDESSKGAASLAHYARQGVEVLVVTCTGGERGSVLNPKLADQAEQLQVVMPQLRRQEMDAAMAILGVEHVWLGFVDSGLPEGDPPPPLPDGCFARMPLPDAAAPLVAEVRRFRPHVIVTYDEGGGYPHPDHLMTHRVAVEAYHAAGDPARYPGTGAPWTPLKLYYLQTMTRARMIALHQAMVDEGIASPYQQWLDRWGERPDPPVTTRVPCAEAFEVRDRALLAHTSQVDPDSFWFACPLPLQQRVWPTEDYQLAHSRVPVQLPEDDLFAGVREHVREQMMQESA